MMQIKGLEALFSPCRLCPRSCNARRSLGEVGFCRATADVLVAGYMLHPGEEPCISVGEGSGTVFFSLCNMACAYCQNGHFSQSPKGNRFDAKGLARIFLDLQRDGAANINLVSPEPYLLQIAEAIVIARKNGLSLPIIYNSSSYVSKDALSLIDELIDVYLLDMKYATDGLAMELSNAPGYSSVAKEIISFVYASKGEPKFDEDNKILKGTIVRHLVLPGYSENSRAVLKWLSEELGDRLWLSLMSQFEPVFHSEEKGLYRRLSEDEYEEIVDYALELGLCKGWFQPYGGDNRLLGERIV